MPLELSRSNAESKTGIRLRARGGGSRTGAASRERRGSVCLSVKETGEL